MTLPDAMHEWIDALMRGGEYANAGDYVRDLIRHDRRERESLRLARIEAERSGLSPRKVPGIHRRRQSPPRRWLKTSGATKFFVPRVFHAVLENSGSLPARGRRFPRSHGPTEQCVNTES
jgi:antitoxin ParD1/3/4